jgi:hypothetical protein
MEAALRDTIFDCAPYLCDGASAPGGWDLPFWAILLLLILASLLIVSFLQPGKKETPLNEAVDKVLSDYETQAQVWDNREAVTAFAAARRRIADIFRERA